MENIDKKSTKKKIVIVVIVVIIAAVGSFLGMMLVEQSDLSSFKKAATGTWCLYRSEREGGSGWIYEMDDSDQLKLTLEEDGSGKLDNYAGEGKSVDVNLVSENRAKLVKADEALFEAEMNGSELRLFPRSGETNYDTYIFVKKDEFNSTVEKYMEGAALPKVTPKPEWETDRAEKVVYLQIDANKQIKEYIQSYVQQGIPFRRSEDTEAGPAPELDPGYEVIFYLNDKDKKTPVKIQIGKDLNACAGIKFPGMKCTCEFRNSRGNAVKSIDCSGRVLYNLFAFIKSDTKNKEWFEQLDSLFRDDGEIRIILHEQNNVNHEEAYTLTEEQKNIFRAVLDICWEISSYYYSGSGKPKQPTTQDNSQSEILSDNSSQNTSSYDEDEYDSQDDYEYDEDDTEDSEYYFPYADSGYISEENLEGMSYRDVWLAKNELYARHGRMFDNEELQEYFDNCSWYTREYTPSEWEELGDKHFFNGYEMANRNVLRKKENELKP